MQNKTLKKSLSLAASSSLVLALTAGTAFANTQSNPFSATTLSSGYMLADKGSEAKCGEAKCGSNAAMKKTSSEAKCGEAKCGSDASSAMKSSEAKCGEAKCGSSKSKPIVEAKCGEAKCGSSK